MSDAPPGRLLPWDSDFFGVRIARASAAQLDEHSARALLAWARAESVDCTYFLADPDHRASLRAAESVGMRLADVRVTFERATDGLPPGWGGSLEPFRDADVPTLRSIAARSHRDGRFHHDGGFPADRCDEFYATWIENSCKGFADTVLVARLDGRASGYISCHLDDDAGRIGLIAVGDDARGRGLGRALVAGSLEWFAEQGRTVATVVTQGRNVPALRLYETLGFRTRSVELWYHLWTSSSA